MKLQQRMVSVKNAQLATEASGQAEKGTILLAMGATASMAWWPDAMMAGLAAGGYQVIRFDHRDTGQSTTHAPGVVDYDIADMADDLLAILDAYGAQAGHLVGMSLGGYVSQIAALQHPGRVLTLTLIASEPLGLAYKGEGISAALMDHFAAMGELDWANEAAVANYMLGIAEKSAGPTRPLDREEAQRRIQKELQRTKSMQSAFNHSMLAGQIDPALKASDIEQPVLLVHGTEDPVISVAAAQKIKAVLPASQLVLLEGAGHELSEKDVPVLVGMILEHCGKA